MYGLFDPGIDHKGNAITVTPLTPLDSASFCHCQFEVCVLFVQEQFDVFQLKHGQI